MNRVTVSPGSCTWFATAFLKDTFPDVSRCARTQLVAGRGCHDTRTRARAYIRVRRFGSGKMRQRVAGIALSAVYAVRRGVAVLGATSVRSRYIAQCQGRI